MTDVVEQTSPASRHVVCSAVVGRSEDITPDIMELYGPRENFSRVLDVTYGYGRFWRKTDCIVVENRWDGPTLAYYPPENVDPRWTIIASDLKTGIDFRSLPYPPHYIDMLWLDPPYAGTGGQGEGDAKPSAAGAVTGYGNAALGGRSSDAILRLYFEGLAEARRVLKPDTGVAVVKIMDQVESGVNRWLHWDVMGCPGWVVMDLFVLVGERVPMMRHGYQHHSRKNLSYYIVMRPKKSGARLKWKTEPAEEA